MTTCEKNEEKKKDYATTKDCFMMDADTGYRMRDMTIQILDPIDGTADITYMEDAEFI